jgi:N-terminal domain of (some) glycogen debranching enzymes
LAVVEGRTFMYSEATGDIPKGSIGGLVHADTRYLDEWVLTVNGARLLELDEYVGEGFCEHFYAHFFLTNAELPGLPAHAVGVSRRRVVGDGFGERIQVINHHDQAVHLTIRLAAGSDFADLFEIKGHVRDRSARIRHDHAPDGSKLSLSYRYDIFAARTEVRAAPPATRIDGDALVWEVDLPVHGSWGCELSVPLPTADNEIAPPQRRPGPPAAIAHDPVIEWRDTLPVCPATPPMSSRSPTGPYAT